MPPPPNNFGSQLRAHLGSGFENMTLMELANKSGVPLSELEEYLNSTPQNDKKPPVEVVKSIAKALGLSRGEENYLLRLAATNELEARQRASLIASSGMATNPGGRYIYNVPDEALYTYPDLESLQKAYQDLLEQVEELKNDASDPAVRERVASVSEQAGVLGDKLTAPIRLPPSHLLTVDLIPITDVQRLEEYRADQTMFYSSAGVALGTALGVVANVSTGGVMTNVAWVLLVGSLLLAGLLGFTAWSNAQRGNRLRSRFLTDRDIGDVSRKAP